MLDIAIIGWVFNLIVYLWAIEQDDESETKEAFAVIAIVPFGLFILFFYAFFTQLFK